MNLIVCPRTHLVSSRMPFAYTRSQLPQSPPLQAKNYFVSAKLQLPALVTTIETQKKFRNEEKENEISISESDSNFCFIDGVPKDILSLIFAWVGVNAYDLIDIQNLAGVCKNWNNMVWSLIKELSVSTSSTDINWDYFSKMDRISVLDINWQTEERLQCSKHISQLKSLKKLLIYHKFGDNHQLSNQYHFLKDLNELETLSLVYFRRTIPFEPELLTHMHKLKQLCIGNSLYLNDKTIQQIATLTNLEQLSAFSAAIGDEGAQRLTSLVNLVTLDISCNHGISDIGIENYTQLKKLTHLDIGGTQVSTRGISKLKKSNRGLYVGHLPGDPLRRETKRIVLHSESIN